jgi:hypothetical protein
LGSDTCSSDEPKFCCDYEATTQAGGACTYDLDCCGSSSGKTICVNKPGGFCALICATADDCKGGCCVSIKGQTKGACLPEGSCAGSCLDNSECPGGCCVALAAGGGACASSSFCPHPAP